MWVYPILEHFSNPNFKYILKSIFSISQLLCPVPIFIPPFLSKLHIPQNLISPITYSIEGIVQVLTSRYSYGSVDNSFLDLILSSASISILYLSLSKLIDILVYIPMMNFGLLYEFLPALFIKPIEYFAIKGVVNIFERAFMNTPYYFANLILKNVPVQNIEILHPSSLTCPICYDLLNEPVESLGFFLCKECLIQWHKQGIETHPVTGESSTMSFHSRALIMDVIIKKYKIIIRNEEEMMQNNQTEGVQPKKI